MRANSTLSLSAMAVTLLAPPASGLTMIEFYLKLKEEKIPKIMLTTEITADLRERGERIGVDAWMQKPLKKEVILKLLSDIENRKKVT